MPPSSTSNFDSANAKSKPRRFSRWLGAALALILLLGAEISIRKLEQSALIPMPTSLDGLVLGRLDRMRTQPMKNALWLLGNSTLAEGINEDQFSTIYKRKTWKLPHGSASTAASVELANLYLEQLGAPGQIALLATVDDFNINGLRAKRSLKYTGYRPKPISWPRQHIHLISNGPRVRQFLSGLAKSIARGKFNFDFAVRLGNGSYDGRPIRDNDGNHDQLFKDFEPDFDFIATLSKLAKAHAIAPPTLILLPVTDEHIRFREHFKPDWTYSAFRHDLKNACDAAGVAFIDAGDTRNDYEHFRDTYHANDTGKELLTSEIANKLRQKTSTPPPSPNSGF